MCVGVCSKKRDRQSERTRDRDKKGRETQAKAYIAFCRELTASETPETPETPAPRQPGPSLRGGDDFLAQIF